MRAITKVPNKEVVETEAGRGFKRLEWVGSMQCRESSHFSWLISNRWVKERSSRLQPFEWSLFLPRCVPCWDRWVKVKAAVYVWVSSLRKPIALSWALKIPTSAWNCISQTEVFRLHPWSLVEWSCCGWIAPGVWLLKYFDISNRQAIRCCWDDTNSYQFDTYHILSCLSTSASVMYYIPALPNIRMYVVLSSAPSGKLRIPRNSECIEKERTGSPPSLHSVLFFFWSFLCRNSITGRG